MSKETKCPVCGKVGIPDYHKENVVCSCCGTDLSIYKMLSDSQKDSPAKRWWKAAIVAMAAVAAFTIITTRVKSVNTNHEISNTLKDRIAELSDSIEILSHQLEFANQKNKQQQDIPLKKTLLYIVKRNDSPCRISKKIYKTEKYYKQIEAVITKPLQPGDVLEIPYDSTQDTSNNYR